MPKPSGMSLTEFAKARAPESRCSVCKLPAAVLAEVVAAREQEPPVRYNTIRDWLRQLGHDTGNTTVENHFKHIR